MPDRTESTRSITIVLIIGAFIIFPMFFMSFGMIGSGPMMGGQWGGRMWSGGTVLGWIFVVGLVMRLLFLITLIGGGYLVYRSITGDASNTDQALEAPACLRSGGPDPRGIRTATRGA